MISTVHGILEKFKKGRISNGNITRRMILTIEIIIKENNINTRKWSQLLFYELSKRFLMMLKFEKTFFIQIV